MTYLVMLLHRKLSNWLQRRRIQAAELEAWMTLFGEQERFTVYEQNALAEMMEAANRVGMGLHPSQLDLFCQLVGMEEPGSEEGGQTLGE